MTLTSSTSNLQIYSGNSLYDPDVTFTGAQPYGFDQLAGLYGDYVVYGAKIELQIVPTGSDEIPHNNAIQFALFPTPDQSIPNTNIMQTFAQFPYAQYKTANATTGQGKLFFKGYMSTAKMFGVSKQTVTSDDRYGALVNDDPEKPWYWQVRGQMLGATGTTTVNVVSRLTYYCKFHRRKYYAPS